MSSLGRALTKKSSNLSSIFTRSFTAKSQSLPLSSPSLLRFRSLVGVTELSGGGVSSISSTDGLRCFSTRTTTSSLNDPSPNWNNRPPKETILLDGCDFEHWLIVVEKPEGDPTRDEIIDSYIKIVASVVGSEEEARRKIYSVSTRHYYAIGVIVPEEMSYKFKEMPNIRWVLPDSYLNVREKDYGGEPFINGQALPYDPKYHEEWVRNNARANERSRRNDRPRNTDRSRNFERRRENMQNRDFNGPPGGNRGPPSQGPPPPMGSGPPGNMGGGPPPQGGHPAPGVPPPQYANGPNPGQQYAPPSYNAGPPRNAGPSGGYPNAGPGYNAGPGPGPNSGYPNAAPPNAGQYVPNTGGAPYQNGGGAPYQNGGGVPYQNGGGAPYQNAGGAPYQNAGGVPYQNAGGAPYQNGGGPAAMPNREYQNNYAPPTNRNMGPPGGNNAYQVREVPGRD
ncbi:hypothetical protein ACHQM5_007668 [Ranunculus cassubicifolius]